MAHKWQPAKDFREEHEQAIGDYHKEPYLVFQRTAVPTTNESKLLLRHTPGGSRYYIARINPRRADGVGGRWAWVRVSNHWGTFYTGDMSRFSTVPLKSHHWELRDGDRRRDGEYAKAFQAGFIPITTKGGLHRRFVGKQAVLKARDRDRTFRIRRPRQRRGVL